MPDCHGAPPGAGGLATRAVDKVTAAIAGNGLHVAFPARAPSRVTHRVLIVNVPPGGIGVLGALTVVNREPGSPGAGYPPSFRLSSISSLPSQAGFLRHCGS